MKAKILFSLLVGMLIGELLASVILFSNTKHVSAQETPEEDSIVTICHRTESDYVPYIKLTLPRNLISNHFDENGTPTAGHEGDLLFDSDVECPTSVASESPQPTVVPDPTTYPQPIPTPTADPIAGKHSSLSLSGPSCENKTIEVAYDVKENGQGRQDVEATFTYRGDKKVVKTDNNGRAYVSYSYSGEGTVAVTASDDYPQQSLHVNPLDCPVVAGVSAESGGQVLGATTQVLGATGTFTHTISTVLRSLAGFFITTLISLGVLRVLTNKVEV